MESWLRAAALAALFLFSVAQGLAADATDATAGAPPATTMDELVFVDGDRVRGQLLRREGDIMVFLSARFGELRVKEADAKFIPAHPPSVVAAAPTTAGAAPAPVVAVPESDESDRLPWYQLRPWHLTRYLRTVFGSWHGRMAFSTEVLSDTADHTAATVEASLRRSWKRDEVKLNLRYDYSETNEVTATDLMKLDATWNHTLGRRWYTVYRPTLEWNREYVISAGVPADYVLLQQELGLGLNVYKGARGRLSVGLSENLFDVWLTAPSVTQHWSRGVESAFAEGELKLPWQITLTDRGVLYYSSGAGWENRFQIDKKLTETLSIGMSHELRYNNPDVRVADYSKLRLMIGVDF